MRPLIEMVPRANIEACPRKRLFSSVLLQALKDVSQTTKQGAGGSAKPTPADFQDSLELFFCEDREEILEELCELAEVLPEDLIKTAGRMLTQSLLYPESFMKSSRTIFARYREE